MPSLPPLSQAQCYPTGESRQSRLESLDREAFSLAPQLRDPATRAQAMSNLRDAARRLCLEPGDADEAARKITGGSIGPRIQRPPNPLSPDPSDTPSPFGTEAPRPGHPHSLPFR